MDNLSVEQIDGGVVLTVKVIAGASATSLCGVLNGMLKVKVSSAPEKGKANKCLIEFLAKSFGVRKKDVTIVSGQTNPVKKVFVSGLASEQLFEKLKFGKQD